MGVECKPFNYGLKSRVSMQFGRDHPGVTRGQTFSKRFRVSREPFSTSLSNTGCSILESIITSQERVLEPKGVARKISFTNRFFPMLVSSVCCSIFVINCMFPVKKVIPCGPTIGFASKYDSWYLWSPFIVSQSFDSLRSLGASKRPPEFEVVIM